MDTVTALPGDIALLAPDPSDAFSVRIASYTKSPYSHSVIALGDGWYADANPNGVEKDGIPVPDVVIIEERARFERRARTSDVDLFRPPVRVDAAALRAYAEAAVAAAKAADPADRLLFSDGALVGLFVLRLTGLAAATSWSPEILDRIRRALVVALAAGPHRLFCSEFAYRASEAAGYRPELPITPYLPPEILDPEPRHGRDLVTLDPMEILVGRLRRFLEQQFGLDADTWRTANEVWQRAIDAYERDARPAPGLDRADFHTPADFGHLTGPYTHVATWDTGAVGWGSPRRRPR